MQPVKRTQLIGAFLAGLFCAAEIDTAHAQDYTYDELGRLVMVETGSGASLKHRTYSYDAVGNRILASAGLGPGNSAPTANDDFHIFSVAMQTDTILPTLNDTDPDGDLLNVSSVSQPMWLNGGHPAGLAFASGSTILYYCPSFWFAECDPAYNWFDFVMIQYTVSDGKGGTDTATVYVEHQ